jgi:hypothetical protein
MALVTGRIGLEDLAIGEGQEVQDLGQGRTRTITKINAGNFPYNNTTTLQQALDAFNATMQSAEALNITENKQAIVNLYAEMNKLRLLADKLPELEALADRQGILDALSTNLVTITQLHNTIVKTEQAVADAKYREHRILAAEDRVSKRLAYVSNLCNQDILPMKSQLDMLLAHLENLINTVKADIIQGNEMAYKLATYTWDLRVVRACKVPKWYIDEATQSIVLLMPQPICATTVEADPSIVQASVDAYLATLPKIGGIDENVTVDDLEPLGSIEVSMSDGYDNYQSFTFDLTKRSTEDNLFYTYGSYSSDTAFKTITGLPLGDYKIVGTSIPAGYHQDNANTIYTIDENHLNTGGVIDISEDVD